MTTPQIAQSDLRQCLADLIVTAEARQLAETDPKRRERWVRIVRHLTAKLACRVLADAGRPVPNRKARRA